MGAEDAKVVNDRAIYGLHRRFAWVLRTMGGNSGTWAGRRSISRRHSAEL